VTDNDRRPDRLVETINGEQWFVFQRERFEVERRGRLRWQVISHHRALDEEKPTDVGRPFRLRRSARRRAATLDRSPGYYPIAGPIDWAAAQRMGRPR